jgi:hypothetical protein
VAGPLSFGTGPTSIRPWVFELGKGPPNFRPPLTRERMEISSRRLRISGRTASPVVFAKFGDPRSIGRASFGASKIFAFPDRRRVPTTGCRLLDPFAGLWWAESIAALRRRTSSVGCRLSVRCRRRWALWRRLRAAAGVLVMTVFYRCFCGPKF